LYVYGEETECQLIYISYQDLATFGYYLSGFYIALLFLTGIYYWGAIWLYSRWDICHWHLSSGIYPVFIL